MHKFEFEATCHECGSKLDTEQPLPDSQRERFESMLERHLENCPKKAYGQQGGYFSVVAYVL